MFYSSRLKLGWMLAYLVAFAFSAHARMPASVSPGAADHFAEIEGRCPSFSWGEVSGADHYQLVAYLLPPDMEPRDVDNAASASRSERAAPRRRRSCSRMRR